MQAGDSPADVITQGKLCLAWLGPAFVPCSFILPLVFVSQFFAVSLSIFVSVFPSFDLPCIPLQAEWGSVSLATSKANSESDGKRGPLAVIRLRAHSLPRIKGWELICKPAKPETMIGFPFCSFDTDLNMYTKWENKIYMKVSRNPLSYIDLVYPVSSNMDNTGSKTHLLFPTGLWKSGLFSENWFVTEFLPVVWGFSSPERMGRARADCRDVHGGGCWEFLWSLPPRRVCAFMGGCTLGSQSCWHQASVS